jgi:hypothetical protein
MGFAGAIEMGYEMAHHDLLSKIRESLTLAHEIRVPGGGVAADPS